MCASIFKSLVSAKAKRSQYVGTASEGRRSWLIWKWNKRKTMPEDRKIMNRLITGVTAGLTLAVLMFSFALLLVAGPL